VLPANDQSWNDADRLPEPGQAPVWRQYNACEGEEMRPYPYGWKRDATACNADHTDIVNDEGRLKDCELRQRTRAMSPFGVGNLAGNPKVRRRSFDPVRRGDEGCLLATEPQLRCAAQTAHDRFYHGTETGFRCCAIRSDQRPSTVPELPGG
jgi:hypothetical protein